MTSANGPKARRRRLLGSAVLAMTLAVGAAEAQPVNPVHAYPRRLPAVPYAKAALDPATRAVLDQIAASGAPPSWTLPPRQVREGLSAFFESVNLPPLDVVARESRFFAGPHGQIPVRIYRPRTAGAGPLPVLVFFHGGGMMLSSSDTYDSMLQLVSSESGVAVVSVDYRLAPEDRFPAGVDDAYAGLVWVHENAAALGVDASRLAVGGDSAGGYLTAVVTQMARDRGGPPIRYQVMAYPAVGTRGHSRSIDLYSDGYFFSREGLAWTYAQYVDDAASFADPRVQPILASDFSRLPPALVVLAEFDILRDDAADYAGLLKQAGTPVEVQCYKGTIHAFLNMSRVVPAGRQAISLIADRLKRALVDGEAPMTAASTSCP